MHPEVLSVAAPSMVIGVTLVCAHPQGLFTDCRWRAAMSRPGGWDRRTFIRTVGVGAAAAAIAPTRARAAPARSGAVIAAPVGGSDEPYPIPWLDKNGSHNEPAGPGQEPSSIFHFQGRVARAANFTGSGVDGHGERLAFGSPTTDNSFMQGECWTSKRRARTGKWAHL
jgi:hypothetical protein